MPWWVPLAVAAGGKVIDKIAGDGGKEAKIPKTPSDMLGMRRSNIGLQNYLLGFDQPGTPWYNGQSTAAAAGGDPNKVAGASSWLDSMYGAGSYDRMMGGAQAAPSMDPGRRAATPYGPTPQSQNASAMPFGGGGMNAVGATPYGGGGNIGAGMFNPGQGPAQQPVPFSPGAYGMQPGGGFSTQLPGTPASNPMLQRMESYFGPLGTPTTALQQQSMGGISQFLGSNPYGQSNAALSGIMGRGPTDYFGQANNAFNKVAGANYFGNAQRGFDQLAHGNYYGDAEQSFKQLQNYNPFQPAQGMLEGMFKANPGQGVADSLHPLYERALAEANQTGGRFGSANAILRSRALDDYNIQMQSALQRGVDQQLTGAGVYGNMGNSLIGAKTAAGQGLLGVGQGRMSQQAGAAQGYLGVGQGQLQQGLGAAQGMLGVGQGRSSYDLGFMGNQINAAGQLANNQNTMFGNLMGGYGVGTQQATQEAERQQQALAILLSQLNGSQQASYAGSGG